MNTARHRTRTVERLDLDETSAATVFTIRYDVLRSLLEADAASRGYKVYNHVCYVAYITEILGEAQLAKAFDDLRRLRNGIEYYGNALSVDRAQKAITTVTRAIEKLQNA